MRSIPTLFVLLAVLSLGVSAQVVSTETEPAGKSAKQLVIELGSPDYPTRAKAAIDLRALADKAIPALEAAKDDPDLERRIRVRALLEELQAKAGEQPVEEEPRVRRGRRTVVEPVRPLRPLRPRRMTEPQRDDLGERRRAIEGEIEAMRRELEEMRKRLQSDLGVEIPELGGIAVSPRFFPRGSGQMSSLAMIIETPEGKVRVETIEDGKLRLTEDQDGEEKVSTFENLAELKEARPELEDKLGALAITRPGTSSRVFRFGEGELELPQGTFKRMGPDGFRRFFSTTPGQGFELYRSGPGKAFSMAIETDEGKFRVESKDDGKVVVTEGEGEKRKTSTYESLDALKEARPELGEKLGGIAITLPGTSGRAFRFGDRRMTFPGGTFGETAPRVWGGAQPGEVREAPMARILGNQRVLGVSCDAVSGLLAKHLKIEGGQVVRSVLEGSSAEKMGIAVDDIILSIDGQAISTLGDIRKALEGESETISVTVLREGERKTLEGPRPGSKR